MAALAVGARVVLDDRPVLLGQRRRALLERNGAGHTDQFAPVRIGAGSQMPAAGAVTELAIREVEDGMLVGFAEA